MTTILAPPESQERRLARVLEIRDWYERKGLGAVSPSQFEYLLAIAVEVMGAPLTEPR